MKQITVYEAEDGSQFRTEEECVKYEKHGESVQVYRDLLNDFREQLNDEDDEYYGNEQGLFDSFHLGLSQFLAKAFPCGAIVGPPMNPISK